MIYDEHTAINIRGELYPLVLTTGATLELSKRYGGIENLGKSLRDSGDTAKAFEDILWLITLLLNQGVALWNLENGGGRKPFTEDELKLRTTPADLAGFKPALFAAVSKGMKREVLSEEPDEDAADAEKNAGGA